MGTAAGMSEAGAVTDSESHGVLAIEGVTEGAEANGVRDLAVVPGTDGVSTGNGHSKTPMPVLRDDQGEVVDIPDGARMVPSTDGTIQLALGAHTPPPRLKSKLAIIGFTPSMFQAPWGDDSYEKWGCNALYAHDGQPPNGVPIAEFTRWFDIHENGIIPDARWKAYQQLGLPVYVQQTRDDMPNTIAFPRTDIERALDSRYFTSTIAWQLALALMMGFRRIEIYGVDMAQKDEYFFQRPCVEYWIGRAEGMGVEVEIARTSDLMSATHQYAFGSDDGLRAKLREKLTHHEKRIAALNHQINQAQLSKATIEGARQATEWMINSWTVGDHTSMKSDAAKSDPDLTSAGTA